MIQFTFLSYPYLLYMNSIIGLCPDLITDNCFAMKSNVEILSCNRVYNTLLPSDAEIEQIRLFFGTTPFTWAVNSDDKHMSDLLKHHNFHYKGSFSAMMLDLNTIDNASPLLKEYTIKSINGDDIISRQLWTEIISQAFIQLVKNVSYSELLKMINFLSTRSPQNVHLYVGYYNNKPVSAGMAIHHQEVVTLHWIGTLPEFRNKGIGYSLTQHMIVEAKKIGCSSAILLSSKSGKALYAKLGFKEYASYDMYGSI